MNTRDALTIRFPPELLADAKSVKADSESFNDFVVSAVDREVRLRQGVETFAEILQTREEIFRRVGLQPDSRPLIRALRDSETRRD
jgi:hypothetical protein